MAESDVVTIVSAESQEAVAIDLRLVGSVTWPTGQNDRRYSGVGTRRWLSNPESETVRAALLPLITGPEDDPIKAAVDLIDYALSTRTGVAVILP
jgi:hypothetical protein